MQTLTWYAQRLRRMSAGELAWRTHALVRSIVDRPRIHFRVVPTAAHDESHSAEILSAGQRLCEHPPGCWMESSNPLTPRWRQRLVRHADAIRDHRFTFFNLDDRHLGSPIDWNRDHEAGTPAPLRFAATIDYRDPRVTGDAKVVWEPGRHHQLVVLGRAYRATGDTRYADEVIAQIDSWLKQCPFGVGMHWRSPLEVAIRAINWVWAFDLIRPSRVLNGETGSRLLNALYLHAWEISRKYSRGSSANNHRIGEAAAVFVVTTCFPGLKDAPRWRTESRSILEEEILAQTYSDGGSREQAFRYHVFVLQFLLLAALSARRAGDDMSPTFLTRLERMLDFAGAIVEGGPAAYFGDSDDGYLVDLGGAGDPREWIGAGAALLGRPEVPRAAARHGETAYWLLGSSVRPSDSAADEAAGSTLSSRSFPESGHYLLQYGSHREGDAVSVLFDCGELGFGSIAAHGHADALAFTLRAFGDDILIDPGTYDYFRFPDWRDYFRSTRAHNTVVVDGQDQSVMLGPFMWGRRAAARCREWNPRTEGGTVEGDHDGYRHLADPVQHSRRLELDGPARVLTITDRLAMTGTHALSMHFHFSESCVVSAVDRSIEAVSPGGRVRLELDPRLTVSLLRGSLDPIGGWVSRGYHRKTPATTVLLSGTFQGNTSFVSRILIGAPAAHDPRRARHEVAAAVDLA